MQKKKLNELEFWGMQFFYEYYGKEYGHDQKKVFERLTQEFGADKVADYKQKCGGEFDRKIDI
ncbi:MAG: hypothetical protein KIC65_09745 [Firmicutes bacterium]|nr:hypothetical protein [Bacillota bacterium]